MTETIYKDPSPQTHMLLPQDIETAPAQGFFLAETLEGDWLKVERYDSPFGGKNTVMSRQAGKWWSPDRWMPLPDKRKDDPFHYGPVQGSKIADDIVGADYEMMPQRAVLGWALMDARGRVSNFTDSATDAQVWKELGYIVKEYVEAPAPETRDMGK